MKNSRTFASILAEIKHKGGNLMIGRYQRPASWGKDESYNFINDAYESKNDNDNNYGAAYLYERERTKTDAVESQQRFLSYISTLCAFKNFAIKKKLYYSEGIKDIIQNIMEIVTSRGGRFPILQTIGQDNIDMEAIVENDTKYIKENKKNTIIKNYNVFYAYIKDVYKNEGTDGLISFFYDGINKGSLSIEYCETEEEVIKAFLRFNRGTTHVTPGQNIFTNIYGKIQSNENYDELEKDELLNRLQIIRADLNNDVFFSRFIYYKTGKRFTASKIAAEFKNIINAETDLKSFIDEIKRIYDFHDSIFKYNIKSDRYTLYELQKLNSALKVFCDPNNCEDIVDAITDLMVASKETIPMDTVIDLIYMLYFTHIRASIMGYSSHMNDGFSTAHPVIRPMLEEKNDSVTYQKLLIDKLLSIDTVFLKQYKNEDIENKLKELNFYRTKFRDQMLNILNNYGSNGEIQNLFDGCNSVQREHILPQNEKNKDDKIIHLVGNITVITTKDNTSNKDKKFAEKIDTFKNSNFLINKNIAEHSKWEEEEILKETERRAKIIAEFTNPLNFCKECENKEIINDDEVKTEIVYAESF